MKQMKRKVAATALALTIATGSFPGNLVLAADQSHYAAQVVTEATSANKLVKPGDVVKVSCYIQNASWAQMNNGIGLSCGNITLNYSPAILQYKEDSFQYGEAVSKLTGNAFQVHQDQGNIVCLMLDFSSNRADAYFPTDDKVLLFSAEFTVTDALPENSEGTIADLIKAPSIDFVFGNSSKSDYLPADQVTITPETEISVSCDTKSPEVTLDGAKATANSTYNFFYQPITVTASDLYNVKSITLDGAPLTAPYTLTRGGKLVVTDNNGNQTTLTINVDSSAFDAAKAAIAALPDTITFGDKAKVEAAQKAVDAVTDETAKNKLDLKKFNDAVKQMNALEEKRKAVVDKIASSALNVSLKQEDVSAITSLRGEVDALTKQGATFTADELKKLTDAESKLSALQQRSKKAHSDIAALPTADNTVWSDKTKLDTLKAEMDELKKLGDTFTDEENAKITAVQNALDEIVSLKKETEAAIDAIVKNEKVSPQLATQVAEVNDKLEVLNSKGIANSDVAQYQEFTKIVAQIQGMLDKIDAVATLVKNLPAAEDVTFKDEAAIQKAQSALADLKKQDLDISEELHTKLDAVQAAMDKLKSDRDALVKEIAQGNLTISLNENDVKAIQSLRQRVDELNKKGAAFTSDELKNLTKAESDLSALQQRSKKAHSDIAALPTAEETVWGDKAKLDALKTEMQALKELGDTFTEEENAKITAVEQGLHQIQDMKAKAEQAIQELLDAGEPSPALATQVNAVKQQIVALNNRGITNDMIEGYDAFAKVAATVQDMLDKIQAVTDKIQALPTADAMTFDDEKAITEAQKALDALREEKLDVTEECAQKLADAQQALEALKTLRADLVKEIAESNLTVSLKAEDVQKITDLRSRVDALNEKKANFTANELRKLTDAEAVLVPMQQRSTAVHNSIAGLPSAENIRWSNKDTVDSLNMQMPQLTKWGDVFTQDEQNKVSAAKQALDNIQGKADALRSTLEQLPTTADANSAALLTQVKAQMDEVAALGYPVDKDGLGETAMQRYNTFLNAVQEYEKQQSNTNTGSNNSNNNGSTGSANTATPTPAAPAAPAATKKPSTAVIKKPTSNSNSTESKPESEATATPKPTEKPASSSQASDSSSTADSSSAAQQAATTSSSSKLVQIIVGAVVAIGAIVGGVYYWLTKKRNS